MKYCSILLQKKFYYWAFSFMKALMLYNKYYSDTDQIQEKLMNANTKLDDREKALLNAEAEVAILNRRIQSLEEELEKTEDRFVKR